MISRCPSCAAQVPEDASRCPSCYWDFKARKRLAPDGAEPAPTPSARPPEAGAPPPKMTPPPGLGGLRMVPFSEALTESKPPKAQPPAAEPPKPPAEKKPEPGLGAGLLQFPKLEPADRKKDDDRDPFALPTPRPAKLPAFSKEPPAPASKPPAAGPPRLPEAKAAEKADKDKLPELRPEDKSAFDAPKPEPRPPAKANPDFLKGLPRERPVEASPAQPAKPEPAALPTPAFDAEPPKTIIRAPRKDAERDPYRDEGGRDPRKPSPRPRSVETSSGAAPAARRSGTALWIAAAAGLLLLGAGAAFFLSPRKDAGLGERPSVPPGEIFAKGGASVKLEPGQLSALSAPAPGGAPAATAPVPAAPVPGAAGLTLPVSPPPAPAPAPRPQAAVPAAPAAPPAPAESHGAVVLLKTPQPTPEQLAPPKPKPKLPSWKFQGRVYDLIALNAVGGAKLVLIGPKGNEAAQTTTSPDGTFSLSADALPAGAGYKLVIRHPDYRLDFIDEADPPLSQAPIEDRKVAAAARSIRPWIGDTASVVTRTIVAIPKNLDE